MLSLGVAKVNIVVVDKTWILCGPLIDIDSEFFLSSPTLLGLQKMDMNQDGVVTLDEFISCCQNDEVITNSMTIFDNILL